MQLNKHYTLTAILCWEGGRIGGSKDSIEIAAATDNPIIRHPITGMPYIPGSSLKGKTRSLLELTSENERINRIQERITEHKKQEPNPKERNHKDWLKKHKHLTSSLDAIREGHPCGCGLDSCIICKAFGPHKNTDHQLGPTQLIFRDARLATSADIADITDLPEIKYTYEDIKNYSIERGLQYAEIKSENIINRHTGRASDPRQMERVIDGSLFKVEIAVRVFDGDETNKGNDKPVIELLKKGISLLEQDYLGGSGSRGYGKVKFYNLQPKDLFENPKG